MNSIISEAKNRDLSTNETPEKIMVDVVTMSDSLHTIIPSITTSDRHALLYEAELLYNFSYPIALVSYEAFESNGKIFISFHLKDYGIRDINSIGYTLSLCLDNKMIVFKPTYTGVTYFDRNDFFVDIIDMRVFENSRIKSAYLFIDYVLFKQELNKHIIGYPFNHICDEEKNRLKLIDKKLCAHTTRLSLTGADHKAIIKKNYTSSAYKMYDELSSSVAVLKKAMKQLITINSELSESSFIISENKDECLYIPIKCYFDKDFYCVIYAAQYCQVISKGVSEGGTLQYIVAVDRKNINLLMLLYYLTISHKKYFTYMSSEQVKLQEYLNITHPAQILSLQLSELNRKYSNYSVVTESPIYSEALTAMNYYFDFLVELKDSIYSRIKSLGACNRWASEYKLFFHIRAFFNDAIFQYTTDWLGMQTIDIFIPSVSCGIEYQGRQHYEAIEFFDKDQSFLDRIKNDEKKKEKCMAHNVRLLEWNYETPIRIYTVKSFFEKAGLLPTEKKDIKIRDTLVCDISSTLELLNNSPSYRNERRKERRSYEQQQRKEQQSKAPVKTTSKEVIRQYNKDGTFISEYSSITEASYKSGVSENSIQKVIYNIRRIGGGYIWKKCNKNSEIKDIRPFEERENTSFPKSVIQIDAMGEVIKVYESISQAVKVTGVNRRSISDALSGVQKTAGGFFWKYTDSDDS